MSIEKINTNLPTTNKITKLNDQTVELDGRTAQAQFDGVELSAIYSGSGMMRQYLRNQSLNASTGSNAWYNWTHLKAESGYSIWRFDGDVRFGYNADNEFYFDNNLIQNRGQATSEDITSFESVFVYDGSDYTDNTTEAASEGGESFNLLADTNDYLYVGHSAVFSGLDLNFNVRAANYTLVIEYWNGSAWAILDEDVYSVTDNTSNMKRDGAISWTSNPSDWDTTTVNSATKYWIRFSTSTTPVTTGKAYSILPYNSVPSLLSLSSQDLADESWAWCEYNGKPYVTFRNSGNSSYEGNWYVTSASTQTKKQNFFRFNHEVKGNYENIEYDYSTGSRLVVNGIRKTVSNPPISSGAGGMQGEIEYDDDYLYIAVGNDNWKRVLLSSF